MKHHNCEWRPCTTPQKAFLYPALRFYRDPSISNPANIKTHTYEKDNYKI
jgi:hypothetical protein